VPGHRSYLDKATESLAGAATEFDMGHYQNAANRAYYACFQAATAALLHAGRRPPPGTLTWPHRTLQAEFVRQLILRARVYPQDLRSTLQLTYALRVTADYSADPVSALQAERALRRARTFVGAVASRAGGDA
jgi:uncharacterized protein (UPF0332 family)